MHVKKVVYKTMGLIVMLAMLLAAAPFGLASAEAIDVNCTTSCDQTTIQAAIDAAEPNSTINVSGGPYVFTSAIDVNKAVILNGVGNPLIQVAGTGYRIILSSAGSTLQGFDIEKTDKAGVQNIISVRNSDITIQNNRIWGQFVIGDGEVSRAMEIQAGAYSNLLISNNEIFDLRQPAYVNGTHTGEVSNNYTHGTKGWVVAGGNLTFVDNTWGTGADANVYDIAILAGVDPSHYPDVVAMAAANNGASIEDQRTSPATLPIVYVDGSVAASGDGTERSPKKTITEGLLRVAEGGVVNVLPGSYPVADTILLDKPVTLMGPVGDVAEVVGAGGEIVNIFEITSSDVSIQNLEITLGTQPANYDGLIEIPDNAISNITIANNKIYVAQQPGEMSTWWARAIQVGRYVTNLVVTGNEMYNTRTGLVIHYNSSATIADNVIYNTKGGIMNYTGSVADYENRVIQNNSWNGVHNEWDIVWNSGGGPYEQDYSESVLGVSQANNDAYVASMMTVTESKTTLGGNRSHVFVDLSGVTDKNWTAGNMNEPYASLELALDAVVEGGTVYVAPGTYAENVVVDKQVNIIGSGSEAGTGTTVTTPAAFDTKAGVFQITGSGVAGSPILLQDLRIEPVGQAGISVGKFTQATGENVSYLTLENVAVIGTNANPSTEQERGLYVDLSSTLDHLVVNNSAFNNLTYGWYFQKVVSADASTVSNVEVSNTSFNHNNHKGIYVEKLTDATFTNCEVSENGYDVSVLPSYFAPWSAGVDINLKAGTYQNLSFIGMSVTDNAIGGAKEGVGMTIKARDDGSSYGAYPAALDNVVVRDSLISGNERGIRLGEPGKNNATPTNVVLENNKLLGNIQQYVGADGSAYGDVINQALAAVDASPNWWGSMGGPLASQVAGDVDITPWCGDEDCSFFVPDGDGVIRLSGNVNVPGGIVINQPGLTFILEDGTVVRNDSPCFVINADYTTIKAESPLGAVCEPTDGSNAFEVNGDRTNLIIEGLEISGAEGANGIDFDGIMTDLVISDNYIHGLPGAGLNFAAQPAGTIQIQGNLFMDNGGNGIEAGAFSIPAEFNAWGAYDGPAAGDGISAGVDADPWTHVDVSMKSAGTDYPNSVYIGESITFDVTADMVNAMGADFVLEFPAELDYLDATPGGLFDTEDINRAGNTIHFVGYQIASEALTGEDLVLFSVEFEGAAAGKLLTLNLDEMNDVFSMAPGYGPSTNIYAAELADITDAEVNAHAMMDIVPAGAYVAGLSIEFSVDIDNADGDDFDSVGLKFYLPGDAILEYWDGSAWVAVSTDPFVLGALAADAAPSLPFRVLFVSPGENVVAVELYDLTPDPDLLLAEAEESFITLGGFEVSGTISMQGRTVRSGVPMKLASINVPYYADNQIFSSNEISNNVLFEGVNGGLYEITTSQPRYLNVSAELGRLLDVNGDMDLPALELKGGNADWSDNVIDISDAGIVGGLYGNGGLEDDGDVNFDDRVNIQDLALVGGNYDLTAEAAYAGWPGFTEVSGTFAMNETTGEFTADVTGAYSLHIVGQGAPAGANLTFFTGTVSGDIDGTIEGMINAYGMDILYAVITPTSGDPVRLYGTLLDELHGWLVSGVERAPVTSVEITGPITVAVGDTIDLDVLLNGAAADRPVLWSVYVNHNDLVDVDLLTGEVTGEQAGTATVIVTVLDDSNVSHKTINIDVTP